MNLQQRQSAGAGGMTRLEHRLLMILTANQILTGRLAQAYKEGRKPDDATIAAFMGIPAVRATRGEYTDVEIVTALADVMETILQRMEG